MSNGYINNNGYRVIYVGVHNPYATRRGQVREHRFVMGQKIGRPLKSHEHVHHLNHNKLDNRPENLVITDMKTHLAHHRRNRNGKWHMIHNSCILCGRSDIKHASKGRCATCFNRLRYWANPNQKHRSPLNTLTHHFCIDCKQVKSVAMFYRHSRRTHQQRPPMSRCKPCHLSYYKLHDKRRRR